MRCANLVLAVLALLVLSQAHATYAKRLCEACSSPKDCDDVGSCGKLLCLRNPMGNPDKAFNQGGPASVCLCKQADLEICLANNFKAMVKEQEAKAAAAKAAQEAQAATAAPAKKP